MVKENKKLRFNVIDLVIVLFMILALVGIFFRYNMADRLNLMARGVTFEIEFLVEDIQRGTEHFLQPGERFHITLESIEIGTVWEILDVRGAVAYVETVEGDILRSYRPERVDVTGIMRSQGRIAPDGTYMLNGNTFVAVNSNFFIHTGLREVLITVMDITVLN